MFVQILVLAAEMNVLPSTLDRSNVAKPLTETITFTTNEAPLSMPFVVEREFNHVGALIGLTYPNGRKLHYYRDDLDRLTRVRNLLVGASYPGNAATPDVHEVVPRIAVQ